MKGSFKSTQMVRTGDWRVAIENKQIECKLIEIVQMKLDFQSKFKICEVLITKLTVFSNSSLFSIKNRMIWGSNVKVGSKQTQAHVNDE